MVVVAEPARGWSLWLSPPEPEATPLGDLILALSRRLGTPPLEPHVTLLGGLDVAPLEKAARLAAGVVPMALPLIGLAGEPAFYRALYAVVETTPALEAAHALARSLFEGASPSPFQPHLSLAYGRLDPEAWAELSAEIATQLPAAISTSHLDLVRTEGVPAEWSRLRRFDLGRNPGVG